jgi:hypothetical protein
MKGTNLLRAMRLEEFDQEDGPVDMEEDQDRDDDTSFLPEEWASGYYDDRW